MAGFRGFQLLFLLPLILGCFLSFSTAGPANRKRRRVDFENTDVLSEDPQTETFYRALLEEEDLNNQPSESDSLHYRGGPGKDFFTRIPPFGLKYRGPEEEAESSDEVSQSRAHYRRLSQEKDFVPEAEHENLGFRRNFVAELQELIENFDQKYVENMTCEKLKEKMSKIVDFIRSSLDFIK